jgi:hypothetical protein
MFENRIVMDLPDLPKDRSELIACEKVATSMGLDPGSLVSRATAQTVK